MNMLDTITTYVEQHELLPGSGTIIVAVSGGADSLCLLHVLHQLCGSPGKPYPDVYLHVAHLNHQLRGKASAEDAHYVAQLAATWDLPTTIGEIDVPRLAREEKRSLEEAARTARYRFLREVAQEQQGRFIAVAHHADDQVETLILHWLRGGGLAGMVGMLPRQQDIIRPLLAVSHAETVAYCQQQGLVPLEDASNSETRFLRNRVRHELLPLLESINPGVRATLLRNAEVMRADMDWIESQVDTCWPAVVASVEADCIQLNARALLKLPLSLRRHVLRRVTAQLCEGQSPLQLRHFVLLEQLLQRDVSCAQSKLDLPGQLHVALNLNDLVFQRLTNREPGPTPFSISSTGALLPLPGRVALQNTPWVASAEPVPEELAQKIRQALEHENWSQVWRLLPATRHTVYVDAERVSSYIEVRTRRPGDRIQPLGMAHEKKVQDVLVDAHVSRAERAAIPLFFSTSHCVWIAGICLDERVKLTNKTQQIVRLSIEKSP